MIDLSRNEFLFPHPIASGKPDWFELNSVTKYQQFPSRLMVRLADRLNVSVDDLRIFHGAEHALKAIFSGSHKINGSHILLPAPGWNHYTNLAKEYHLKYSYYPYAKKSDKYVLDEKRLFETIDATDKPILLLSTPSNPLGTKIPDKLIEKLSSSVSRKNGLTVIDDVYDGYSGSGIWNGRLMGRPDTLTICSMSKYYGIAGLRVGFAAAPKQLFKKLSIHHDYLGFNVASESIAVACMEHEDKFERIAREVIEIRSYLTDNLSDISGFKAYESSANFFLMDVPDSKAYATWLEKNGIRIRCFDDEELKSSVRVTIPPKDTAEKLLRLSRQFKA